MKKRFRVYLDSEDPIRKEFFDIVLETKGIGFLWETILTATIPKIQIEDLQTGLITQGDPYYEAP